MDRERTMSGLRSWKKTEQNKMAPKSGHVQDSIVKMIHDFFSFVCTNSNAKSRVKKVSYKDSSDSYRLQMPRTEHRNT